MEDRVEPSISELIARIDFALAEDDVELSALRQELAVRDGELSALRQEIAARDDELSTLREKLAAMRFVEEERNTALSESELTLSQLHDSQTELQHYFLLCQQQADVLRSFEAVQARTFALLAMGNS